ncbi:MAG: alginate export family protein [Candidatus Sulfotelmatobacter sp.]
MRLRVALCLTAISLVSGTSVFAQQQAPPPTTPDSAPVAAPTPAPDNHKLGPLDFAVNWRARVEGWDWFKGTTGHGNYTFGDSLLRVAIGQHTEHVDWFLEGAQVGLVDLPDKAVVAAPQGQFGLGGNYYAANSNNTNNVDGFLKQGFVKLKNAGSSVELGRFEYFDGLEVKPKDPTLATLIQTRVSQRLISNFGFATVERSFDGVQVSSNVGRDNFTFLAARPTEGVFQVEGMGELDVDTYYGAFTMPVETAHSAGELRVFGLGYVDHRTLTLKTDNRPASVRATDLDKIEIATYGADYVHVFNTSTAGKFNVLGWVALQGGSWGELTQRASAFVGEVGWQPPAETLKPWLSAGYSYGSGDGNNSDTRHGTFFQVLPTPRQYARFPFYNMMDNEDLYATLNLRPVSKLALRSEVHTLRLANAKDLWYSGGGAFQENTFGYTGRPNPGNGNRGLANVWDLSADYQFTHSFSANVYYGHAWGKTVVDNIYPKDPNGQLLYLETNFRY